MTIPASDELDRLRTIADNIIKACEAKHHLLEQVRDLDPVFDSGGVDAALLREIRNEAFFEAAQEVGCPAADDVVGGAAEIHYSDDGLRTRRWRLRKARRAQGKLRVEVNGESALAQAPTAEQLRFAVEDLPRWIMAVVHTQDGRVEEVVAAQPLGTRAGSPGRFVFGHEIPLGSSHEPDPAGFVPFDDDLPGFGDEDADGDAAAS